MIQIEHSAAAMAEAIGLGSRSSRKQGAGGRCCEDCFFHRHMLCALDLDEPCSTFRPDSPDGLAPPLQPSLLPRQANA